MSSIVLLISRTVTIRLCHAQNTKMNPKMCPIGNVLHTGGPLNGSSSPVIVLMPPQTGKGRSPGAEQSFGTNNMLIYRIVFKLCMTKKKEKKEKANKSKPSHLVFSTLRKDTAAELMEWMEQNRKFSCLVFSTLRKGGTYGVDLA